jgi:hypothetical protein
MCDDIYTLLQNPKYEYMVLQTSRNKVTKVIEKQMLLNMFWDELIYQKNIVIVKTNMYILIKIEKLRPILIKIPKPTLEMNNLFYSKFYLHLSSINKKIPNIYYSMYNMALRNLGFNYISKYDIITTFCQKMIYTKLYLINLYKKNTIFTLLNEDIIYHISEYVPHFYSKYDTKYISNKCKSCYTKYHAGVLTNYHHVDESNICGLCNHKKNDHSVLALICPSKYNTTPLCGCMYSTYCICSQKNRKVLSHQIFTIL